MGLDELTRVAKISRLNVDSGANPDSYPVRVTFVLYSEVKTHDKNEGKVR